jgi:hypothetical protein
MLRHLSHLPTLSVQIPTSGRASLSRAVLSVLAQPPRPGDEVIVTFDNSGDWGHTPRNDMMRRARANYMIFLDDDDLMLAGALEVIRQAVAQQPGAPHLFRMAIDSLLLWQEPRLEMGNVGTPMFVIPTYGPLGVWTPRRGGDFDFICDTVRLYQANGVALVWRPEVICQIRPSD